MTWAKPQILIPTNMVWFQKCKHKSLQTLMNLQYHILVRKILSRILWIFPDRIQVKLWHLYVEKKGRGGGIKAEKWGGILVCLEYADQPYLKDRIGLFSPPGIFILYSTWIWQPAGLLLSVTIKDTCMLQNVYKCTNAVFLVKIFILWPLRTLHSQQLYWTQSKWLGLKKVAS